MLSVFDHRLFHLINAVWTNRLFDAAMPVLTDLHQVRIFAFVLLPLGTAYWLYRGKRRAVFAFLGLVLAVGLADAISHRIIKPLVHRHRPDSSRIEIVLRTHQHSGFSFPSNHAANCFAAAMFLGSVYPPLRIPFFLGAATIAYSRVYVGVHYPLDVLAGALLGIVIGGGIAFLFRRSMSRLR